MSFSTRISRRSFVLASIGSCVAITGGCGLLLYPERRGQRGGRLDWGVVLLDGLGLLLFFVPGVIAFIVDFATGTIYLPPEPYYGRMEPARRLRVVRVPRGELTRERVEEVASSHVGRPVRLVDGRFQTEPLERVEDFWEALARRAAA